MISVICWSGARIEEKISIWRQITVRRKKRKKNDGFLNKRWK